MVKKINSFHINPPRLLFERGGANHSVGKYPNFRRFPWMSILLPPSLCHPSTEFFIFSSSNFSKLRNAEAWFMEQERKMHCGTTLTEFTVMSQGIKGFAEKWIYILAVAATQWSRLTPARPSFSLGTLVQGTYLLVLASRNSQLVGKNKNSGFNRAHQWFSYQIAKVTLLPVDGCQS